MPTGAHFYPNIFGPNSFTFFDVNAGKSFFSCKLESITIN